MEAKRLILEETFINAYNIKNFSIFIKEFFNTCMMINREYKDHSKWPEFSYYINSYTHVGNYMDENKSRIAIFAVELKKNRSVERARSMQRNFVSKLISNSNHDAAIVAFYSKDEPKWRLSLVRLDYEFAKGRANAKLTPAKRYSYLVGEKEPCHTAMERLLPIFRDDKFNPTLDNIEQAFNVEKVTEEFFNKYREKYYELKEHLDNNEDFNEEAKKHKFTSEQFAKKLMGQLAFIYFLQKKGWLGVKVLPHVINDKQYKNAYYSYNKAAKAIVPKVYIKIDKDKYNLDYNNLKNLTDEEANILSSCFKAEPWGSGSKSFIRDLYINCLNFQRKGKKNFFDDYLEPLFYEALNHKRGENQYYKRFNCKIPFLNGGLFQPLGNYDWQNSRFKIPDELFSNKHIKGDEDADGILDVFERYNFTMNEDEPLEREVAVDPEMLGKIFENLLDVKDRKSKGAFYTPREIVHYMCQESLINYLVNETGISYDDIKTLIKYGEIIKDEDTGSSVMLDTNEIHIPISIYKNLKLVDDKLADVRVADPAVGSGAYPMGMISEIVKARNNITAYYAAQYTISNNMSESEKNMQMSIRASIYDMRNPYKLKRETIKNSIYAVDIEASAVDIAKLRLWLSLIVDEDLEPSFEEKRVGIATQRDPQPLPNLDYNIMCGNSLIEEFDGVKLFDDNILNKGGQPQETTKTSWQLSIFNDSVDKLLDELLKLQDKYFNEDDTERKNEIKKNIDKKIDDIIRAKLLSDSNADGLEKYERSIKEKTKPYFLWKLEFTRVFKEKGGFDIVIGNPPYGAKFDKASKAFLQKKYPLVPDCESADYFIFRTLELSKYNGIINYIIPNTILVNIFAKKIRRELINKWCLISIDDLSSVDVFKSATVRSCILTLSKDSNIKSECRFNNASINQFTYLINNTSAVSKNFLGDNIDNWLNIFHYDEEVLSLINKIKSESHPLCEFTEISQGLIPYDKYRGHSEELIKKRLWHSNIKKDDTYRMELQGKDLGRYKIKWNGNTWISYGEWLAAPRKKDFFTKPRILIREITNPRIFACYTDEEYYNTPSIINVINFKNVSIKYILALINSKLMSFYHNCTSPKANKGLFPKILVNDIRNMPIALTDDKKMKDIIELVERLIMANVKSDKEDKVKDLDNKIDNLVYEIYKLSDIEVSKIESYFNNRNIN